MTIDPARSGPAEEDRAGSALGRVLGRLRRIGPEASPSRPPARPVCAAMTSPSTEIAVSVGDAAPMSSPHGAEMRSMSCAATPASSSRSRRRSCVLRLPSAPM